MMGAVIDENILMNPTKLEPRASPGAFMFALHQ